MAAMHQDKKAGKGAENTGTRASTARQKGAPPQPHSPGSIGSSTTKAAFAGRPARGSGIAAREGPKTATARTDANLAKPNKRSRKQKAKKEQQRQKKAAQ